MALKLLDLVLAPDIHADLRRKVAFLVFKDKFLLGPCTSCGSAGLHIHLTGNPALQFHRHYSSVFSAALPILTTSTSKMRTELGEIPRVPLSPYASSEGI